MGKNYAQLAEPKKSNLHKEGAGYADYERQKRIIYECLHRSQDGHFQQLLNQIKSSNAKKQINENDFGQRPFINPQKIDNKKFKTYSKMQRSTIDNYRKQFQTEEGEILQSDKSDMLGFILVN